jgi:hypothetical protein
MACHVIGGPCVKVTPIKMLDVIVRSSKERLRVRLFEVHAVRRYRERTYTRHRECGLHVVPISLVEVCLRFLGLAAILCPMPKATSVEALAIVVIVASILGVERTSLLLARTTGATSSIAIGLGWLGAPLAVAPLLHPSKPLLLGEVELAVGQQQLIWG